MGQVNAVRQRAVPILGSAARLPQPILIGWIAVVEAEAWLRRSLQDRLDRGSVGFEPLDNQRPMFPVRHLPRRIESDGIVLGFRAAPVAGRVVMRPIQDHDVGFGNAILQRDAIRRPGAVGLGNIPRRREDIAGIVMRNRRMRGEQPHGKKGITPRQSQQ